MFTATSGEETEKTHERMSYDSQIPGPMQSKKGPGLLTFGLLLPGLVLSVVAFPSLFRRVRLAGRRKRPPDLLPGRLLASINLMGHLSFFYLVIASASEAISSYRLYLKNWDRPLFASCFLL
jgi:hypothetical protein